MLNQDEKDQKFARDFYFRFNQFRAIEAECLYQTLNPKIAPEAWHLLHDLELAYSAKSYVSCICLTCAMIEIHFRRVVGAKGKLSYILKSYGLDEELGWLTELRNDIMHGNPNDFVNYMRNKEDEDECDRKCRQAFYALHMIAARCPSIEVKK